MSKNGKNLLSRTQSRPTVAYVRPGLGFDLLKKIISKVTHNHVPFCVTCCKQRWHLGITSPSSVCLSVCLSVCPSVCPSICLSCLSRFSRHTSLFCNKSSSTNSIEMKLHIGIDIGKRRSINLASILELFPFVNFLKMPGQVTHVFRETPNSSY